MSRIRKTDTTINMKHSTKATRQGRVTCAVEEESKKVSKKLQNHSVLCLELFLPHLGKDDVCLLESMKLRWADGEAAH